MNQTRKKQSTVVRLFSQLKGQRIRLTVVAVSIIIYIGLSIYNPMYSALVIDHLWQSIQAAWSEGVPFAVTWTNMGRELTQLTFYGSLLAHVVFNPIASNLTARDEEEILCRQIIVEGIMAIQSGENPKFLRERLMTFMNQKLREGGESGGGTGEKKERKRRKEK